MSDPERLRILATRHPCVVGWARHRQTARIAKYLDIPRADAKRLIGLVRDGVIDDRPGPSSPVTVERTDAGQVVSTRGAMSTLAELLDRAGVNRDAWAVTKWIANKWDSVAKGEIVELWQVKAWLSAVPAYAREPIQSVKHLPRKPSRGDARGMLRALIVPDSQNGYRVDRRSQAWEPLHDRKAWDLAIQVAQRMQPDTIVMLGDMLDLAPFGKYSTGSDLLHTTQPTLQELHWWIGQLRQASPSSRIVWLEGNHEMRLRRALVDGVSEAADLRPVDDASGPEALSVARLMALDALGVEYVSPYPDAEVWLYDSVRVYHGTTARNASGASVSAVIRDATSSAIFGHIHRLELVSKSVTDADGQRTVFAMSPGTLCRLDGVVPGATRRSNWQQGLGIVDMMPAAEGCVAAPAVSVIPIQDGRCVYDGRVLYGESRIEDIREATGLGYL